MNECIKSSLSHLENLESQSINIIREVASEFQNPVMMYSIGKDSSVMLHLAMKAFAPSRMPFKLLHVDTTWKFREMISFRNQVVKKFQLDLLVHINKDGLKNNIGPISHGSKMHTDVMKTQALKQALNKHKFDAALGGARRDEEKSRAKERIFSFRDTQHRWDPKNQRPELWNLYNAKVHKGENIRAFPISNWTEMDVWQYIEREKLDLPSIYFAHNRDVVRRNGAIIPITDVTPAKPGDKIENLTVRFRTVGDITCTAPVLSEADTVEKIILETASTVITERGETRLDDQVSDASMEQRKKEGYF